MWDAFLYIYANTDGFCSFWCLSVSLLWITFYCSFDFHFPNSQWWIIFFIYFFIICMSSLRKFLFILSTYFWIIFLFNFKCTLYILAINPFTDEYRKYECLYFILSVLLLKISSPDTRTANFALSIFFALMVFIPVPLWIHYCNFVV